MTLMYETLTDDDQTGDESEDIRQTNFDEWMDEADDDEGGEEEAGGDPDDHRDNEENR